MIFFLEKNLYKFLIGKSLDVDKLTDLIKTSNFKELKKYITPITYFRLVTINDMLAGELTGYRGDCAICDPGDYIPTAEEQAYVKQDIRISFEADIEEGKTEKYYEIIKAPNGNTVVVYNNYIVKYMSYSKENLLRLLNDIMAVEYKANTLLPELFKKYLTVKDKSFNISTLQLKLLQSF